MTGISSASLVSNEEQQLANDKYILLTNATLRHVISIMIPDSRKIAGQPIAFLRAVLLSAYVYDLSGL